MANKPKFDEDEDFDPKSKKSRSHDEDDDAPKGKAATRKPIENEEDLDCDFGNPELERRKDPMPRVRPDKGKAVRFALLEFVRPKNAFSHYIDKKGTYRCLSNDEGEGVCCQQLTGEAQRADLKIVALVVKYTNCDPKTGKYEGKYKTNETDWEIGHVSLSRSNYTQINRMVEDEEDANGKRETVYDFDVIMTHNEATGIGYTLTRASRSPRWKKDAEIAEAVKAAAEPFKDGKLLTSRLGRKISVPEWKALIASLNGGDGDDDDNNDDL